jgi:hypothetical protein
MTSPTEPNTYLKRFIPPPFTFSHTPPSFLQMRLDCRQLCSPVCRRTIISYAYQPTTPCPRLAGRQLLRQLSVASNLHATPQDELHGQSVQLSVNIDMCGPWRCSGELAAIRTQLQRTVVQSPNAFPPSALCTMISISRHCIGQL